MAAPLIFISHSASDDAEKVAELAARLREAGFEPWLDRDILEADDEWRREIDEALTLCNGGVVVVSPAALDSEWVKHEASVLSQHRRADDEFVLVTMLVDGLVVEDLHRPDWEPQALWEFQTAAPGIGPTAQQSAIKALSALLERDTASEYEERLENVLVKRLAAAGTGALRTAAGRLGIRPSWRIDRATALTRQLLRAPMEQQYEALAVIADVDAELALKVYELVAPHSWISAVSAEQVRTVAKGESGKRGLALNTALSVTCLMHVRCGFHTWRACEVLGPASDRDVDELVAGARLALLHWMGLDFERDEVPCDRMINDLIVDASDMLPFLVLPPEAAFPAALEALRERWPDAPIVLRHGDEPLAGRQLETVTPLTPPIDAEEEARIVPLYERHQNVLNLRMRHSA